MPIIVGTDFSAHAREAADVAAAISRKLVVPLKVVHVADPDLFRGAERGSSAIPLAVAREDLSLEVGRLREEGANVEGVLLEGSPDEAIPEYASRISADFVTLGALGRRAASNPRLGSAAERIAQRVSCPVLLLRTGSPFIAWIRDERPLRVTVGDDFSSFSDAPVRWLRELRRIGPIEATVAHVYSPLDEHYRLGYSQGRRPDIEAVLRRDLKERLNRLGETDARILLAGNLGRAADPLVDLAIEDKADLVVIGTHQRRFAGRLWYGSVSHVTMHLAPMSVGVVPAREAADAAPGKVPQVRRVLASTDLSPLANLAIPHACALLGRGGQLLLVHVLDPVLRDRPEMAAAMNQLQSLIPPEAAERGIEVRVEVLFGVGVASSICQAAERFGADVICLGSHGRSGVTRLVLGSIAQEVITRCSSPVLLVKPH